MDTRLAPLADILSLNTRLFLNCLADIDDAAGLTRVSASSNNLTFVAVHVLDARAYLCGALGGDGVHPFTDMLSSVNSIEDAHELPKLSEIRAAWVEVSERLMARLARVSEGQLHATPSATFPISDSTVLGMVAFLVQHDSYHVGQLSILRRQLGFAAMSYSEMEET